MQIIHRTSSTEQLFFTAKPDASTRAALRAAGWRWNRLGWWRNVNGTTLRKPKDLADIIGPAVRPEAATA